MIKFLIPFLVFAASQVSTAETLTRIVVSKNKELGAYRVVLKSTLNMETQRYLFEMCEESVTSRVSSPVVKVMQLANCRIVGSHLGYTLDQLIERSRQLKSEARKDQFFDVAKIFVGTVLGAAAGSVVGNHVGLAYYNYTRPQNYHVRSLEVLKFALAGMGAGAIAGGTLTSYLVWGSDAKTQMELIQQSTESEAGSENIIRIELEDLDMAQAIRELNITLAGIF